MPYLDELQKINGIKIFPINVEENSKAKAEIFFKSLEIKNLSIYFDLNNKLLNLFYVRGLPTSIILNKDRKEVARILGAVDFSDQKFIDWINSVSN
jgi:thiol-disulfide isomerase/thioredoxin